MSVYRKFTDQFKRPEGFFGMIAGKLMATIGAEKNEWTLSLLKVNKDDNVLEVGFGPGVGIEMASKIIQNGKIVGIDYAEKMLQQAQKRNRDAIQNGKVELILADAQHLPSFNMQFDKVFSINSIIFWEEPVAILKRIRELMKEKGVIAITVQPFMKGATEETAKQLGMEIMKLLEQAGFSDIKIKFKQMKPVATVCVLGLNR